VTPPRLIINADDLGAAASVNAAVARTEAQGTITSASLMVGGRAAAEAADWARRHPGFGLGLHLTLTQGRPLSEPGLIPNLVDASGAFLGRRHLIARCLRGLVPTKEVALEFEAQVERASDLGVRLTHLDGHQHVHILPPVADVAFTAAKRLGLAVRIPDEELLWFRSGPGRGLAGLLQVARKALFRPWLVRARGLARGLNVPTNDHFRSPFGLLPAGQRVTLAGLTRLTEHLKPGLTEIMVHPAEGGDVSWLWGDDPDLLADRLTEANILASEEFRQALAGLRLTTYADEA
jgi:predicted glycoside hydrolase/deacetylase ChbG (UPF0249 family)